GQALQQDGRLRFVLPRNEQAMVHTAVAYAKQRHRLQTWACTSSIGPGATNMVTGAATATVNRLPVLLLPGDVFASRGPDPVLQQLEAPSAGDMSVNDCFRPVSRYFDRIQRPEQVVPAALQAMRVLVSQAETGAVTLAFPQDVQAEAYDFPEPFLDKRVWHIGRPLPAEADLVLGIGTRWSDFTTASKTAFRNPEVRFVNINVADFDAAKHAGLALVGDARATLERLAELLEGFAVDDAYRAEAARLNRE